MNKMIIAAAAVLLIAACDARDIDWGRVEDAAAGKSEPGTELILKGSESNECGWSVPDPDAVCSFLGEFLEIVISEDGEDAEVTGPYGTEYMIIGETDPSVLHEGLTDDPFRVEYRKESGRITGISLVFSSGKRIECCRSLSN